MSRLGLESSSNATSKLPDTLVDKEDAQIYEFFCEKFARTSVKDKEDTKFESFADSNQTSRTQNEGSDINKGNKIWFAQSTPERGAGLGTLLSKLKECRKKKMPYDNVDAVKTEKLPHFQKTHSNDAGKQEKLSQSNKPGKEEFDKTRYPNVTTISNIQHQYTEAVQNKIIRQVEYYFGDYNLPKDRFLQDLIREDPEGWVSMDTMLTFKRLAELSQDVDFIMKALEKSENRLMEVDFLKHRIRRRPDKVLPEMDETRKLELEEKTVFVSGFPKESTLDDMLAYFENEFEGVSNIRMRYSRDQRSKPRDSNGAANTQETRSDKSESHIFHLKNDIDDRKFMGSLFVTFETKDAAKQFLKLANGDQRSSAKTNTSNLSYQGQKLKVISAKNFHQRRYEDNDQFFPDKIRRTIYVNGFDKTDTSEAELLDFFGEFGGAEIVRKRVYRSNACQDEKEGQWMFTGTVFLTFDTESTAKKFFEHYKNVSGGLRFRGDLLTMKWQEQFYEERKKFTSDLKKFRGEAEE